MQGRFVDFARQWTPVAFSHELRHKPLGVTLAGERVVVWRASDTVGAALDRCPHRGVKLSLGRVRPDGCLECPFHGWRFDAAGACTHVPLNPSARRDLLGVPTLPVRERGGMIWVFTETDAVDPGEPSIPEDLLSDDLARFTYSEPWRCHWTRAMENMLDYPHLPFVHWNTIGFGARRALTETSEARLDVTETPEGFRIDSHVDGAGGKLFFYRPNGMSLEILPPEQGGMRVHAYMVPIDGARTKMMNIGTRAFGRYNPFYWLTDRANIYILRQDRGVTESHDPVEVPPPSEERSVASDRPTLAFRQWYLRNCKGSHEAPRVQAPVSSSSHRSSSVTSSDTRNPRPDAA